MLGAQVMLLEDPAPSLLVSSPASEIGELGPDQVDGTDGIAMAIDESHLKAGIVPCAKKRKLARPPQLKPFLELVQNTEGMKNVYNIVGRGTAARLKLVIRDPNGYKYHPSTIRDLVEYQQRCILNNPLSPQLIIHLVAKLIQDK